MATKGWSGYHAKWPNPWAEAVCRLRLTGLQSRVLIYVVARTWGDYDGRRQRFGRSSARLSSRDIAKALGGEDPRAVRKALAQLLDVGAVRRFREASGRRPAAIGPDPLLASIQRLDDERCGPQPDLETTLADMSPQLRAAVEKREA